MTACHGLNASGQPCGSGAQRGHQTCPRHRDQVGGVRPVINYCQATTKSGSPCRAGAEAGWITCRQHRDHHLGYGDSTDSEDKKPWEPEIPIHRTTGIIQSMIPMTTAKGMPYIFMIVGDRKSVV